MIIIIIFKKIFFNILLFPAGCTQLTSSGLSNLIQLRQLEELELTNCPGSSKELIGYLRDNLPSTLVVEWTFSREVPSCAKCGVIFCSVVTVIWSCSGRLAWLFYHGTENTLGRHPGGSNKVFILKSFQVTKSWMVWCCEQFLP